MSDTQVANPSGRRLGRGLSALLGGNTPAHEEVVHEDNSQLVQIPVDAVTRNEFQPRKEFETESLAELAGSIREHGVLQPLLVREIDNGFQLVAGERRLMAARKAGLTTVPCRVIDVIDKTACEFALEENLKRKDLNDLEKAQAFKTYIELFECSIEELAKQLSMSRSAVSNLLRLLDLTEPVKKALSSGKITAGHARALLPLDEASQLELCGRVQAESLSVRQIEQQVRQLQKGDAPEESAEQAEGQENAGDAIPQDGATDEAATGEVVAGEGAAGEHASGEEAPDTVPFEGNEEPQRTAHVDSLEEQLRDLLGVKVQIKLNRSDSGTIMIPFSSNDEFERILRQLRRDAA
ncbi:Chromosome-partitioning protein Spo0J [Maioricimonas rarisocia]|uniref:Chromosome-partitioning protein Spo0J n=1 Tax=Maioricimonas rarisocia TaxID=2528026 RepID=A0A517ZBD3_9PLAN|nr:ParB/RepB/Spo0J family partition protein [Maioricimonas rarisocia]QDU39804.1 Chromosome-partitioning protein Spo0J [Maioricimonas rarisocia]